MTEQTVTVRLKADVSAYKAALHDASRAGADMTVGTEQNLARLGQQMNALGSTLTRKLTLPLFALGTGAAVAAVHWESAWAGVTKTVDGTAEQLADLEAGLRDMAKELPATHGEIAAVAEAAGQLGVAVDDVEQFTRVMIDLGETTNLTSDAAATSIAQMMNIMQSAPEDVERLASTLVELGNNGASTEREILDMALRLAGAGQLIGLAEGEVLALANAMASVGIQSQLGGGAMSRAMLTIYDATQSGGAALEAFAETADMSASEFATAFREDPATAIQAFIEGLGRIDAEGGNVVAVLKSLGLEGTQDKQVLLSLASAGDLLGESLQMQERAWIDMNALSEEAAKRYETTAAELGRLRNNVVELGISVGSQMLGPLASTAEILIDILGAAQGLSPWVFNVALGFGALLAAVGPIVSIGGTLVTNWGRVAAGTSMVAESVQLLTYRAGYLREAISERGLAGALSLSASRASAATSAILAAHAPLIALGATVAVGTALWSDWRNEQKAAEERARSLTEAIKSQGYSLEVLNQQLQFDPDVVASFNDIGVSMGDVAAAVSTGTDVFDDWQTVLLLLNRDSEKFIANAHESGPAVGQLAEALVDAYKAGELTDGQVRDLIESLDDAADASDDARDSILDETRAKLEAAAANGDLTDTELESWRARLDNITTAEGAASAYADLGAALAGTDSAYSDATDGVTEFTEGLGENETATDAATEAIRAYQDALRATMDPWFGALDALDRNADAQAKATGAQWDLIDAEKAYNEAVRLHGRNSDEAAAAALNLMGAQERLADANRDAVQSAMDVDSAMFALATEIQEGGLTIDGARGKLAEWVEQGRITQTQADEVTTALESLATAAGNVPRDISMVVNVEEIYSRRKVTEAGGPSSLRYMAGGGQLTRGSRAVVGDAGPEVVDVGPDGSVFVHPNTSPLTQAAVGAWGGTTAAMSASGTALSPGGGGMNVQLVQQIDAAGLDVDALSEVTIRKMMWRMGLISRGAV